MSEIAATTGSLLLAAAIACQAMTLIAPIYYVVFKARFWAGFFVAWFFLYCADSFYVHRGWILHFQGLTPEDSDPADLTNISLTACGGWIVALPYCLLLWLLRGFLVRFNIVRSISGE